MIFGKKNLLTNSLKKFGGEQSSKFPGSIPIVVTAVCTHWSAEKHVFIY